MSNPNRKSKVVKRKATRKKWKVLRGQPKTFKSLDEVGSYMEEISKRGEFIGRANSVPSYSLTTKEETKNGKTVITGEIQWTLKKEQSVIELPDWKLDKRASPEDKAKLKELIKALEAHEVEHIRISQRGISEVKKQKKYTTFKVEVDDSKKKEKAIEQELKRIELEVSKEVQSKQEEYDKISEHGIKQKDYDPKGENTVLESET